MPGLTSGVLACWAHFGVLGVPARHSSSVLGSRFISITDTSRFEGTPARHSSSVLGGSQLPARHSLGLGMCPCSSLCPWAQDLRESVNAKPRDSNWLQPIYLSLQTIVKVRSFVLDAFQCQLVVSASFGSVAGVLSLCALWSFLPG